MLFSRSVGALVCVGALVGMFVGCSSKSSRGYLHVDNQVSASVKFVFGPSANDALPWNTFVDGSSPGNGPGKQISVDAQGSVKLDLPSAGHYRWGALEVLPDPTDPSSLSLQLIQDSTFDTDGSSDLTLEVNGQSTIDAGPPQQATCGKTTGSTTCSVAGEVACGNGRCCAPDHPYWCNSKCYPTAAAVYAAGCATDCLACGSAPATTGITPGGDSGTSDGTTGGPRANGQPCASPSDCSSGKCVKDFCSCDDAGHSVCPCLPSGASCGDNDNACCSLSCGFNSTGFCD